MTNWVAIAAKTPEMAVAEQKASLAQIQAEMEQLRAQIAAAKKTTPSIDVQKETIEVRKQIVLDSSIYCDAAGNDLCWGDLVEDE